jgi:hypothetical protein
MAGHKTDLGVDVGFPQPDEMSSFFGIDKDYDIVSAAKSGPEGEEMARVRVGISPTRRTQSRESFAGFLITSYGRLLG